MADPISFKSGIKNVPIIDTPLLVEKTKKAPSNEKSEQESLFLRIANYLKNTFFQSINNIKNFTNSVYAYFWKPVEVIQDKSKSLANSIKTTLSNHKKKLLLLAAGVLSYALIKTEISFFSNTYKKITSYLPSFQKDNEKVPVEQKEVLKSNEDFQKCLKQAQSQGNTKELNSIFKKADSNFLDLYHNSGASQEAKNAALKARNLAKEALKVAEAKEKAAIEAC